MGRPHETRPAWVVAVWLLLITAPAPSNGVFRTCATDSECQPPRGTCDSATNNCVCIPQWAGDRCQTPCAKADLGMVLDASGSINVANWRDYVRPFVEDLTDALPVGVDNVRIGIVTYSNFCEVSIHLNSGITRSAVKNAVLSDNEYSTRFGSSTDTPCGLDLAESDIFKAANGDRPGVNNFGLVITDGYANMYMGNTGNTSANRQIYQDAADRLKAATNYTFAFGVNGAVEPELIMISTDSQAYFVNVPFTQMDKYLQQIKNKICEQAVADPCPRDIVYLTTVHNAMPSGEYDNLATFVEKTAEFYTLGVDATATARVDCTHTATTLHDFINDRTALENYYSSYTKTPKTVAVPLPDQCWSAVSGITGDRAAVDDQVIYISSMESRFPDAEKLAKDALTFIRRPICIAVKYSDKHVKQMADTCVNDHLFIVDAADLLSWTDYINEVACDGTTPCDANPNLCNGQGKCANQLSSGGVKAAVCICNTGFTGATCDQPIPCKRDIFTVTPLPQQMTVGQYKDINNFISNMTDVRFYDANDMVSTARVECAATAETKHTLRQYTTVDTLEAYYQTLMMTTLRPAVPLNQNCWTEMASATYDTNNRASAEDHVFYISTSRGMFPAQEETTMQAFIASKSPDKLYCIAVNVTSQPKLHMDDVSRMCAQHDVFLISDTAQLDHTMAVYMNDIVCGDKTAPCSLATTDPCNGNGKCFNTYPAKGTTCNCGASASGPTCNKTICEEVDLVIVMDRTMDITPAEWQLLKDALVAELGKMPISTSGAHVGLYVYDKDTSVQIYSLNGDFSSPTLVTDAVQAMQQNGRAYKKADEGLTGAYNDFVASSRPNARRHAILITNKYVYSPPLSVAAAKDLIDYGVEVHVIGAQTWVASILTSIVDGQTEKVILIDDYAHMGTALEYIIEGICKTRTVTPTCAAGCPVCVAQVSSSGTLMGQCVCNPGYTGPTCADKPECLNNDLTFIVDSSQSNFPMTKYDHVRKFAAEVSHSFPLSSGANGVQMAAVLFGFNTEQVFGWSSDAAAISNGLLNMNLMNQLTFINKGIDYMRNIFGNNRIGNSNYGLVLLDGYSSDPAKTLQSVADSAADYEFFVVGYSHGVQPQEALAIAGGNASRVLLAETHDVLPLLGASVRMAACGLLDFGSNDPCANNKCKPNGVCIKTMSSAGQWTATCVCSSGYVGGNCDIPTFPCDNADLVIAVDSALVQNTAAHDQLYITFADNYRSSYPNNRLDIVEFSSAVDNSAGILQIKTKLDAAGARNNMGFVAGRLGLLFTSNLAVTAADRTAMKQLRDSGTNSSIISDKNNLLQLETLLEPRDRNTSVRTGDITQFGHQHHVVQAMLCREQYTDPPPSCADKNVCFLIDSSQSVSNDNYANQKAFVINFIQTASASANFKAAVRQFAYWATKSSDLTDTLAQHVSALNGLTHAHGLARVETALTDFPCFPAGTQGDKIIIILMDGPVNSPASLVTYLNGRYASNQESALAFGLGVATADVTDLYTGKFASSTRMVVPWADLNSDNTLQQVIDEICSVS